MGGENRRIRVCKIISKSTAEKVGTSMEKVREEFAVLKKLDHPHVVRIFGDFEDDSRFYLLMEQCKGGDLQEAVKKPGTSDAGVWEQWVAQVIFQALSAIAYCHGKGVIHKDLKPENVMLSRLDWNHLEDTHTVVVDFGLAEMFSSSTDRSKEIAGTPPFMAPEVWAGNFSKKCDIWSSGVILFFMLSGQYPFIASRIEDFPKAVAKEPKWEVIGGASPEVQQICRRMLCKSEAGRPLAQELLGDQWFTSRGLGTESIPNLHADHYRRLMEAPKRSHFEKFVCRLV